MSTCTIVFDKPKPRDGTGEITPDGCELPKMRGRKKMNRKLMIQQLKDALESLADTPCSFWACDGPNRPRYMITCGKCWAMRNIASAMKTLERQQKK